MGHKTLTLTFCVSLWDPTRNDIGLFQSKVYRMSTMTGNLYVVHRLCITKAEWAPSKFYIRPLDEDLANSKGSHMLEVSPPHPHPPLISTYNLSQDLQWRHYPTNFSALVDQADPTRVAKYQRNCLRHLLQSILRRFITTRAPIRSRRNLPLL